MVFCFSVPYTGVWVLFIIGTSRFLCLCVIRNIFFVLFAGRHDDLNYPGQRGRTMNRSPLPSPIPSRSNSREPLYRATSLETRSRSPSPHPTPTPTQMHEYYGSVNLTDRSRSPSPTSPSIASDSVRGFQGARGARRLPVTPQKPSSLQLD